MNSRASWRLPAPSQFFSVSRWPGKLERNCTELSLRSSLDQITSALLSHRFVLKTHYARVLDLGADNRDLHYRNLALAFQAYIHLSFLSSFAVTASSLQYLRLFDLCPGMLKDSSAKKATTIFKLPLLIGPNSNFQRSTNLQSQFADMLDNALQPAPIFCRGLAYISLRQAFLYLSLFNAFGIVSVELDLNTAAPRVKTLCSNGAFDEDPHNPAQFQSTDDLTCAGLLLLRWAQRATVKDPYPKKATMVSSDDDRMPFKQSHRAKHP
ncbi:hypothetical protein B0H34DRAFT_818051 [Crassisporium funariophilum]|nr:hypothetical protein B0H34DRAFT_818051 [Crassisporium funariophilum]